MEAVVCVEMSTDSGGGLRAHGALPPVIMGVMIASAAAGISEDWPFAHCSECLRTITTLRNRSTFVAFLNDFELEAPQSRWGEGTQFALSQRRKEVTQHSI